MSSNAELGWSVRDAEVLKSMQRIQADNEKMKQQLADITNKSKQAGDAWTSGLRSVSAEQQRIAQGQTAWEQGLTSLGGKYRSLREQMLDTSQKAKGTADTWAAGLRTIGEQQRPILDGHRRWSDGLDNLKSKITEVGAASQNSFGDIFQDIVTSNIGSLKGMVAGLFAVDKVLEIVQAGYQDWAQTIEDVRLKHENMQTTAVQTLAATGDLARLPALEQRAGGVQGATKEQWFAAFGGVSGAAMSLPSERRQALADEAAKLAVLQKDPSVFSRAVGDLAEAMPQKSPQQVADLALTLQQLTGEKFGEVASDRFQRTVSEMQAGGMSAEQAMAVLVAGRRADVDPRTLETLALSMASSERPGRVRGPDDALKNQYLATAPGQERLALLQSNKQIARAVLGEGYDTRIGLLTPEAIAGMQTAIAGAGGESQRQLAAFQKVAPGAARLQAVEELKSDPVEGLLRAGTLAGQMSGLDEALKASGFGYGHRTSAAMSIRAFRVAGGMEMAESEVFGQFLTARESVKARTPETAAGRAQQQRIVERLDRLIEVVREEQRRQPPLNVNGHVEKKE